jgi:alpha-methylacyl-CoA racemase
MQGAVRRLPHARGSLWSMTKMGPLSGIRIVEIAGIGPAPMCTMLLADLGASVLRIERDESPDLVDDLPRRFNVILRGRPSLLLNLKNRDARDFVLSVVGTADVLIEGFRPGVAERLGIGPEPAMALNPKLVYGRMTGWGQDGPLAMRAGHDITYLALSGALNAIGRKGQPPTVPLNLVSDFAGGALYLALGILSALVERQQSGLGQVVDAAMIDGTASLMAAIYGMAAAGNLTSERGTNLLDSGAYFYDVYECADGKWLAIGALEQRFHDELLRQIGIDPGSPDPRANRAGWPRMRELLKDRFRTRTRDEWQAQLEPLDVCAAPVLSMSEAPIHPHLRHRRTFVDVEGVVQPAAAPRFSRTPTGDPRPVPEPGVGVDDLLREWQIDPQRRPR